MASLISPGIIIKERDLSNAVVTNALAITGAFASTFAKGPVGEIVNISTQKELLDTFGKPNSSNAEDWFVASEFLNYGGRLAVVRAETAGLNNANSGANASLLISNSVAFQTSTLGEDFAARTPGTWGNALKVIVADRGADQIITLSAAPTTDPVAGGQVTFNLAGGGTATAEVVSYSAQVLTVVLDNPATLITEADAFDNGADPDVAISSVADWWSNTSVGSIALSQIGPRPGTSEYASARGIKYDELHIAVVDATGAITGTANTIIERLTYLSKLTDARGAQNNITYYKDAVNEFSEYVYTDGTLNGSISPSSSDSGDAWGQASGDAGVTTFKLSAGTSVTLSAGADDYDYSASEIDSAYDVFLETEDAELDFILMGGSMATEDDTKLKAASVMAVAQTRKDCIAFVSPWKGAQVGTSGALTRSTQKVKTINFFNALSSTSYAVFDSGYKYMYDRFNDIYRWIPCNGDVAGLCVSTSATLDDWYSPAGTNRGGLRNAVKLAFNPTQADRDELYQARINPIVSFPGTGVILFGDKTALASPSAFDRINVRRLFLNIQKRAEELAKGVLFELNDATTRIGFASALNSYLSEVQARRGVTDFLVVCDESNNTPAVVDRNEFVAEIYIKPTRSINYITVTLTATKTGVAFSEVIGA